MSFDFRSLAERKLFHWALGYIGAAWLVLQLFDVVADPLSWGSTAFITLVVALVAGLPIVLVLAWYHGEQGRQRVSGPELIMIGALLAVAGTAVRVAAGAGPPEEGATGGVADLAASVPVDSLSPRAVAVLPFANVSRDPEDAFFTDGMHEEVITRLSRIGALRVISRTSVMQYRGAEQNVRAIARELGAGTVLEGSVRRAGVQLRVTAQLIDARTDTHLWAETYDRVLSTDNVFDVQTDIASRVARSLEASLTPAERERVEDRPTDNLQAYEFMLRGMAVGGTGYTEANVRRTIAMYEQAVELDPEFGEAFARLAREHDAMIWYGYDRSPDRESEVRAALGRARELAPEHYQTTLAEANYHYHRRRYDEAIERFQRAQAIQPNGSDAISGMGFVRRRQGRLGETVDLLTRAIELDPASAELPWNLGETLLLLKRCDAVAAPVQQAIDRSPDWPRPYAYLALSWATCYGDTDRARAVLGAGASAVPSAHRDAFLSYFGTQVDILAGGWDGALVRLGRVSVPVLEAQFWYVPRSLLEAEVHRLAGRPDSAAAKLADAVAILEPAARERSDDERIHAALGMAYALMGRRDAAVREGRRAVELMPMSVDAYKSALHHENLARILVLVGRHDEALALLADLLDRPSLLTSYVLRLDPRFDAIRDDPRFQELARRPVEPVG